MRIFPLVVICCAYFAEAKPNDYSRKIPSARKTETVNNKRRSYDVNNEYLPLKTRDSRAIKWFLGGTRTTPTTTGATLLTSKPSSNELNANIDRFSNNIENLPLDSNDYPGIQREFAPLSANANNLSAPVNSLLNPTKLKSSFFDNGKTNFLNHQIGKSPTGTVSQYSRPSNIPPTNSQLLSQKLPLSQLTPTLPIDMIPTSTTASSSLNTEMDNKISKTWPLFSTPRTQEMQKKPINGFYGLHNNRNQFRGRFDNATRMHTPDEDEPASPSLDPSVKYSFSSTQNIPEKLPSITFPGFASAAGTQAPKMPLGMQENRESNAVQVPSATNDIINGAVSAICQKNGIDFEPGDDLESNAAEPIWSDLKDSTDATDTSPALLSVTEIRSVLRDKSAIYSMSHSSDVWSRKSTKNHMDSSGGKYLDSEHNQPRVKTKSLSESKKGGISETNTNSYGAGQRIHNGNFAVIGHKGYAPDLRTFIGTHTGYHAESSFDTALERHNEQNADTRQLPSNEELETEEVLQNEGV